MTAHIGSHGQGYVLGMDVSSWFISQKRFRLDAMAASLPYSCFALHYPPIRL